MFPLRAIGPLLGLLLLCSCATRHSTRLPLPADVPINPEAAGLDGWLIVPIRLADGEEVPFMVDSGSSDTIIDKSFAPKLGKPVAQAVLHSWGTVEISSNYAAPPLYLGGVPLLTGPTICTYDCQHMTSPGGSPVMGILSYDCLCHYCLQLDFAALKMRFLDARHADKKPWGKSFRIIALNSHDRRPAIAENLLGLHGPHSLIDSGCNFDGWLQPGYFQQWTNTIRTSKKEIAHSPVARLDGEKYPFAEIQSENVESDGIGLRFLARHLVTLDFPEHHLYLQRQSIGPLPDPGLKTTRLPALDSLIADVAQEDLRAARHDLAAIEQGSDATFEKDVARHLEETLENLPKPVPSAVSPEITRLPLGDAQPESAEVGWLKPVANRIPLNAEIPSPLLDSGQVYATGLFAHAPSRYVYALGGRWKTLTGEAGLHIAFQHHAYGVIFVIKADGREVFRSDTIHNAEHPRYNLDVNGVNTLEMIVEKAQDRNGGNWALWLDPVLTR